MMLKTKQWILFISFSMFLIFPVKAQQIPVVNLAVQNVTLKELIREIEKQTEYTFIFNSTIDLNSRVSVNTSGEPLDKLLDRIFSGRNITFEIAGKQIVLRKTDPVFFKERVITGNVYDESEEPVIGASVSIKGTSTGTVTDINGGFSLRILSSNTVLIVSYLGYSTREIRLNDQIQHIKINLRENLTHLNEVVVVGYGTQKKLNLTGAVAQISSVEIEDRPLANLSQVLQGAIPNLNVSFSSGRPGTAGTLNIRGNTSINGGSPLVLIDGVEGNIDRINPNDVESVSVLKDASASAIYGARASFGVILVTTKQGQKGKMNVRYNGRYSFSRSTTSTDYETRGYYSAKINDDFYRSYAGKNFTSYTEDDYYQLWIRRNDKTEHPDRPWVVVDQREGRDTYVYYANMDLYNYLYDDTRPTWEHNLSISGGNEIITYLLSGNFFDQAGIIRLDPDRLKRYNFRSKVTAQVTPWFEISNNTSYHSSTYDFPGYNRVNDLFDSSLYSGLACWMPVNPDGSAVYYTSMENHRYAEGRSALLVNGLHKNSDIREDFNTTFEATFHIFKNFNIKANYSHSKQIYRTVKRSDKLSYSKYPGEILERTDDIGISRLSESIQQTWYNATNVYGNYTKKINDHNLSVLAGYNYEAQNIQSLSMSREGLLTTELSDFNLAKGDVITLTGGKNAYAIMGGFYRINYDYKGKYLFETSGRYDGTSRFRRGDRYGFFPSASVGWRISDESFFKPLRTVVDDMKIRYSYGALGNQQAVGYYDYLQLIDPSGTMSYSFGEGSRASYASVSAPNAGDLTWEKVYTNNFGLDFLLLDQRFSVSADFYRRDTKGMLTKGKTLPATYGASSPKENAADLRTKGWEIAVSWTDKVDVFNKILSYKIGLGLSDYVSHITKYDNPTKLLSDYYEGQKLGDLWGYHIDGFFKTDEEAANYPVDQSAVNTIINSSAGSEKGLKAGDVKYLDLDGDDVISFGANTADSPGDRSIIGNTQPRYMYGINVSASWNGFDFSTFWQGVGRQHWYPAPHSMAFWGPYSRPFASYIPRAFMDDVWSEENPDAYFPRARGYTAMATNRQLGAVNDRYLQNLAYCRLKNLTFGYTLPKQVTSFIKLEHVRVYFSGENLLTFTKLRSDYIDPEQATAESGTGKTYPWAKTFSFGIDISF